MAIQRRSISIFSMSFLDVISCGFGAVLLIFLLVSSQAIRQSEQIDKQSIAIAVKLTPVDANGRPTGEKPIPAKMSLVVPPANVEKFPESPPNDWIYNPQRDDLSSICKQITLQLPNLSDSDSGANSEGMLFCVLRGVRVRKCAFQVVLAKPPPANVHQVLVEGWLSDPLRGHNSLDKVFIPAGSWNTEVKAKQVIMHVNREKRRAVFEARLR